MTQSTVWVTGTWGVELPWVGMETEVCPYLDGGSGCRADSPARTSGLHFPIFIQEIYPTGGSALLVERCSCTVLYREVRPQMEVLGEGG